VMYGDCVNLGDERASRQRTVLHFPPHQVISYVNNITVVQHPPYLSSQNRRRCLTPSQNTTSGMHFKKSDRSAGKVHPPGRGLIWRWWWLEGSKLVFYQIATPVPEIMDEHL
jgi:hypothetical protein